jgi:hypothetical protein
MRKHSDTPLYLIVALSVVVLAFAVVRLAGPGGPLDLTQPTEPPRTLAGR